MVKGSSQIISLQTKNNGKYNKYFKYGLPAFAILVAFIEVFSKLNIQSLKAGIFWLIIFGVGVYKFIKDILPTLKTSVATRNSSDKATKSGELIPQPILSFYSMTMIVVVCMFLLARIGSPLLLNGQSGYLIAISSLLLLVLAKVNLDKILALELVFCTNCGLFKTSIDKKLIRCGCQIETSSKGR